MIRIVLRLLNAPILILLVAMGIAIQSALFYSWPLNYFQPDVVLLTVVWCALGRSFEEGGIITLIIASLSEIHSGAPQGFFMISYMLVYLSIRAASRYVMIPNVFSFSLTAVSAFAGFKVVSIVLLHMLGASSRSWQQALTSIILGMFVEGTLAFWFYRWLEKFDWVTFKNARAEHALDDELQLDSEGL